MWSPRNGFVEKTYRRVGCEKEGQSWERNGREFSYCEQGPGLDPQHRGKKKISNRVGR